MKARILVVDDEVDFIELISFNLRPHGYEVVTALNGLEAPSALVGAVVASEPLNHAVPGRARMSSVALGFPGDNELIRALPGTAWLTGSDATTAPTRADGSSRPCRAVTTS